MSELDLYPSIVKCFKDTLKLMYEVPFKRKRIDIAFCDKSCKKVYAIEVKLNDWKKALKQAALNQIVCNYSYVALPESKINRMNQNDFEYFLMNGVGLFSVGERVKVIITAQESKYIDEKNHSEIKEIIISNYTKNSYS